jgi:hypothetical protein
MPRWIWITLASLLLLLCWLGLSPQQPLQLRTTDVDGASAGDCPLPEKFRQPDSPLQSDIGNRIHEIKLNDATIIPLAGFSLQARVLGRENYAFGEEAEFSPIDLALGWGPMAELGMAEKLNISQSGRFYRYSWGNEGPPIPQDAIVTHSANMHMVPADNAVAKQLKRVSQDDVITLHGWLIRIEKPNGWRWQSSLTRSDSGNGACELVYVCAVDIKH